MKVSVRGFGPHEGGREGRLFELENGRGMRASFTDYGASIVGIWAPDRQGRLEDVVLGHDTLEGYVKWGGHLGATCGRFANRLRGSRFMLNGQEYLIDANKPHFTLHGGNRGFSKVMWEGEAGGDAVTFSLLSPDGDQGFPGNLEVEVRYVLTGDNVLRMEYRAKCDRDTVVNLTNHAYFNLSGHGSGDVHQKLRVNAEFFNPQDSRQLPTGEVLRVEGTPFDFREFRDVAEANAWDCPQIAYPKGLDHNFLLNRRERGTLELAGALYSQASGRLMEVYTTQPAMMVYTANGLGGMPGKAGAEYHRRGAVCMETQGVPDSMAHTHFQSPILRAGGEYREVTEYRFTTAEGL